MTYQNRHRQYSSSQLRFLQRDSLATRNRAGVGYFDGFNLYAYLNVNPPSNSDPFGMYTRRVGKCCFCATCYEQCLEDQDCQGKHNDCYDFANLAYHKCMAAADLVWSTCTGPCNGNCGSSAWCATRCCFCGLIYGPDVAYCRSALAGALAGCELSLITCKEGCVAGSLIYVPNDSPCPPNFGPC